MPKIIENLQSSILTAANEILIQEGFGDFSIRAIAKKLGIAPATIYNYFPSKENILEALVDDAWHKLMLSIDESIEGIDNPLTALNRIYSLFCQSMNPLFSHWLTLDAKMIPPDHPSGEEILSKKKKICAELNERIETVLKSCGRDVSFAPVYTNLFIMCSHHGDYDFNDIVTAIKEL